MMAEVRDGASNTYLVGEKYLMPENYDNGSDPADNESIYLGCDWDYVRWTENPPIRDTSAKLDTYRFGSAHPGGFNAVFCDGSVHGMSYSIDPLVHQYLGNRKDGQVIDEGKL